MDTRRLVFGQRRSVRPVVGSVRTPKHRLAFVLTRAAAIELERGDAESARRRAAEALELAIVVERPSDVAWARLLLVRAAAALGDSGARLEQEKLLRTSSTHGLSADVRNAMRELEGKR